MLIRIGYDIALNLPFPTAVVFVLRVHPTRAGDLLKAEDFRTEPQLPVEEYFDRFGNHCGRVNPSAGIIRFLNNAVIRDSGEPDTFAPAAAQLDVQQMPVETLNFIIPSRYCEVDSELLEFAWQTFGTTPLGWSRVQAICDFVHNHLRFDYLQARATRTALDSFRERVGVCRDFTHLAITLCRCMNIPARYVTGYLGDIGVPPVPDPMDFSAWFEVYLGERWYTFDARHNRRRIGRIPIGRGLDAGDVPITMVFARHTLVDFRVITEETGPGEARPSAF
ncbi:MAG TPA: transglutaminase family protein [Chthoniobacterales bacterium]|jgi:transglutaminase-like putative cysteine protease|nr:transglutaminase family protein [Chthoniobacterales bacterium]